MAVIQIGINVSFILNFCPATGQQQYKNETGENFRNVLAINLVKHSSEFLAHIKNIQVIQVQKQLFLQLQSMKKQLYYGSYLNQYKYFFHFKLLASYSQQCYKNETGKFRNVLAKNSVKYSSEFLAHIKKGSRSYRYPNK